ncbi:MAG: signal peptidase [Actinoplanes sp.]|nr:signal peptidase [Actinoplanes sp.]
MKARVAAVLRLGTQFILLSLCSSIFWALAPTLAGLHSHVIMSGSMVPQLRPGDVIVTMSVGADRLHPGMVMSFTDPADPGRNIVHRLLRRHPDGTLQTRGDANAQADSTPVPVAAVVGVGVLRVPFVGLPAYWARTAQFVPLGVSGVLLFLVIAVATNGMTASTGPARHRRRPRHAATVESVRRALGPGLAVS